MSRPAGTMPEPTFEERVVAAAKLDYQERKQAENRLKREVVRNLRTMTILADDDDVAIRRTVVELLRRNARRSEAVCELLLKRLRTEKDIKTRRRLSAAIGSSDCSEFCEPLLEQLEHEEHRFVQASLILALGKLGFSDWPPRWRSLAQRDGPVGSALRLAMGRSAAASERSVERPPGRYLIRIYPGLEKLGQVEWQQAGLSQGKKVKPGWVAFDARTPERLEALGNLRTTLADYMVVTEGNFRDFPALLAAGCREILSVLPQEARKCSFRLALPRMKTRHAHHRSVKQLSREVAEVTGWVNNPSRYDVDLRIEPVGDAGTVLWRDMSWPAVRAGELRRALPASLHPTVAAGLCLAVLERLQAPQAPVLLDPCCGAGTILREWLSLAPDSLALGYDLSEEAVGVSRLNLQGFAPRATIEVGDMGHLPLETSTVDAVIANLPFGIRVKHGASNRRLYRRFLTEAIRLLRPGGQIVAYTGDGKALEFALSQAGIPSERPLAVVGAGGLETVVYRVER